MFARLSTFEGPPDRIDEGIQFGKEKSIPAARQIPGFKGVYFLVDRKSGKSVAITLWESPEAMKASEKEADRIRSDDAAATGERIVSVERFEVAVQELV